MKKLDVVDHSKENQLPRPKAPLSPTNLVLKAELRRLHTGQPTQLSPERIKDTLLERHLRPIAAVPEWRKQRRMWKELRSVESHGGGRRSR